MNFKVFLMFIILSMIIGMLLTMQLTGVNAEPSYVPPAPTKTPLEIEMEVQAAISSFYMWTLFKWFIILSIVAAVLWSILYFIVIPAQKSSRLIYRDPKTGTLPISVRMVNDPKAPAWKQVLGIARVEQIEDYSLAIAPTRLIKFDGDNLEVKADLHGATVEQQMRHVRDVTKVSQTLAAGGKQPKGLTKGEAAVQAQEAAGLYKIQEEIARTKLEREKLKKEQEEAKKLLPVADVEEPIDAIPQYEKIDFLKAMELSRNWSHKKAEIVIGQAGDDAGIDAGMLAKLDLVANPMVMVSGKPNSGKTKGAAFTIVAAAVMWRLNVIAFEPATKRDWSGVFGKHVAYHEMNSNNADAHITMLEEEYNRRSNLLRDAGYIEWNECKESAELCPPMLIVLEEFSVTLKRMKVARPGESDAEAKKRVARFVTRLTILVLEARASGMMILAIQQRPDDYPPDLLSSFKHIVYQLEGGGQGNVVNSPRNHLLMGQGHFDMNLLSRARSSKVDAVPVFFWGFDTKHSIGQFLDRLPPTPMNHNLVPNGCCESVEPNASERKAKAEAPKKKKYMDTSADQDVEIESARRQPVTVLEYPLQRIWDKDKDKKHGKWEEFAFRFVKMAYLHDEDHPMRKWMIAELCDRMAIAKDGKWSKESSDNFKSQSAKWIPISIKRLEDEKAGEQMIGGMTMKEFKELVV